MAAEACCVSGDKQSCKENQAISPADLSKHYFLGSTDTNGVN